MIPLKLQLKNFLSYGPQLQTIDFTPYGLICLSGKNGHGKSALLDAVTWAIWGQARKTCSTSKPDAGLLHLGQTTMLVILDFECNGQTYRVKREYFRTYGKPLAQLEFGIFEQDKNNLIPLTDKTIRKTQEKIVQTLHLDYDAFVNTAFLRQGHSNEFSQKSPKDRKAILSTILGLDQYEIVRKCAMEKVREATNKKNTLSAFHEKMVEQLNQKKLLTQSKKELVDKEKLLQSLEKEIAGKTKKLHDEEKVVLQKQKEFAILKVTLEQQQKECSSAKEQLQEIRTEWKKIHHERILAQKYPQLVEKKTQLTTQLDLQHKKLESYLQTKNDYLQEKEKLQLLANSHMQKVTKQQSEINLAIKNHEMKGELLEKQIKTLAANLIEQHKTLQDKKKILSITLKECDSLQQKIKLITTIEKQFEKRKEAFQRWVAHGNHTRGQLEQLQHKKELVIKEDAPCCPLCEQNLSASRKKFLQNKFADTAHQLVYRCKRLKKYTTSLKKILIEQHKTLEQYQKEKEKINELQANIKQYKEQEKQLEKNIQLHEKEQQLLEKQLTENNTALTTTKKELEKKLQDGLIKNKDYLESKQKVKKYEELLQKTTIDKKNIENIKQELETLEKKIVSLQSLQEQINQQPNRKKTILHLCRVIKKQQKQVTENLQKANQYNTIEKKESDLTVKRNELETERTQFAQQKEQLMQAKATLLAQEQQLETVQKEQLQLQKDLANLDKTAQDYQIIATATSKDGMQALLIEDAIPEIEHEANELLSKLTDGQAHIIIESLRDLKKGGTRETLDIHISDTSGIRPYELFSGGEAFRIDFALRIAISKLLARRAGTALQTLIIDEGFGSQDEQGLSQIMDAIYRIQDDFAKVIIVSHLSTMKNQFPVHFSVHKHAQGSQVSVIEQG